MGSLERSRAVWCRRRLITSQLVKGLPWPRTPQLIWPLLSGGFGGKGGRRVDTRSWCPRGGTGAATAGNERLLPPDQASGGRWPGRAVVAPVFGLCFRSRRSAGRPAGSAGGVAGGPAGVSCRGPAQCAGPADVPRFPWQSGCERQGVPWSAFPAQTMKPPGRIRL